MKWIFTPSITVVNCGSAFALAPVVLSRPVAGERPQRRQLHTLRPILNELFGGPACGREAPADIGEVFTPDIDAEGKNCVGFGRNKRGPILLRLRACGDEMYWKQAYGTSCG
jgi:hypothetical protein